MAFKFVEPTAERGKLLISLAGAAGSGKTYSAMELASGICQDKPFAVIDTEAGRAKHYRDTFKFRHGDLAPPFTPEAYLAAIQAAEQQGFPAIVIDSMSHEWDGEGGLIDIVEKAGGKGPGAWSGPKSRHKKLMNHALQCRSHLIFCLRADEKLDLSKKDERGKVIVEDKGWTPICEKRFMYDMTISFTLAPTAPGMVDLKLPHKVQDQHRMAFLPGEYITGQAGDFLRRWSDGEQVELPHKKLWDHARRTAQQGTEMLRKYFYQALADQPDDRANLKPIMWDLAEIAKRADANKTTLEGVDK